jgi:polyisoprenoid-binding protein YceI
MIWFAALLSLAQAHTINFAHGNFAEAKSSRNFIKFEMAATKIGILTTPFDGFARKFSINYEMEGNAIKTARLTIPIEHLDTDVDGRNEKMKNDCLNYKKFPDITILVADPIPVDGKEHSIPAIINLRGVTKPILLTMKAERKSHKLTAEINGSISLKDLEIPDPSIFIASVRDQVGLKARLEAAE